MAAPTIKRLPAPIVGAAATPDLGGYFLVAKNGSVFNAGNARFEGSTVHEHINDVVGIAAAADTGYWLATSTGAVYDFGAAGNCGDASTRHRVGSIVAIVATPDGAGYWLATSKGAIYNFGDAGFFGSGVHLRTPVPVVSMATSPDGKGYWLAYANGSVRNFGDARFFGSAVHVELTAPIVSIAATPDGGGYWLVGSTGRMARYGDARFYGSLAHEPPAPPVKVVAVVGSVGTGQVSVTASPYPHGAIGFDVSNFQCSRSSPAQADAGLPPRAGVAVLEVVGWLDGVENPCLSSQATWATKATDPGGAPYSLYLFMNSPGADATSRQMEATGPGGTCSELTGSARLACEAYNFGYNGAARAVTYAQSQQVKTAVWWLDVENDALAPGPTSSFTANEYWSASTALNAETIQGAIDAIRGAGGVAGIYSSSIQYNKITGGYVPRGPQVPLWIAGVSWTNPPYTEGGLPSPAILSSWCAGTAHYVGYPGTDVFAGGVPWLLQETPGNLPSPYGLDPDYAC